MVMMLSRVKTSTPASLPSQRWRISASAWVAMES